MYSRLAGSRFDPRRARAYLAQPDTNADGDTERRSAIKADLDAGVRFLGRSKRSVVKGAAHDRPLVPAEATRKLDSCAVLHGLGATPATPVTILSDGADGPRSLGETANAPRGAHLISKVRSTGVTLDRDYAVAERWARAARFGDHPTLWTVLNSPICCHRQNCPGFDLPVGALIQR
jgi:hypothetical protein